MSTINEFLDEIDDLKKKIEEEPRKKLKRKLLIDDEIDRLKQEKDRAGLKGDFSSVTLYNSKIKLLQQEKSTDKVFEYNEKIKRVKEKITNIILDYYQEGYVIDDIFIKEGIPSHIQKEWLDKSDFGRNTGYLFVDELNEENYNWIYINPITDFEEKFINLNDLKDKINKLNKIFFIFDNDLSEKSKNKDLIVTRKYIADLILKLDDDESDKDTIFRSLKEVADKFDIDQINNLSEFLMKDIKNYSYFNKFNYILEHCDGDFDNVYENLIDYAIIKLNGSEKFVAYDVFDFFEKNADRFNFNQINGLSEFFMNDIGNYSHFDQFNYILEHCDGDFDKIYENLINFAINNMDDLDYFTESKVFNFFEKNADRFNLNQINGLSEFFMRDIGNYSHFDEFNYILEHCDGDFDKIYENLIDNAFDNLDDLDSFVECYVFDFFKTCADKFNKNQILKFYNYIVKNIHRFNEHDILSYNKYKVGEDFNYILECNKYKLGEEFIDNICFNLIENGINKLKDNSSDVSAIFKYLKVFSIHFTKNQLNELSKIVLINNEMFNFVSDYKYILETNNEAVSRKNNSKIINSKIELINNLEDISGPIMDLQCLLDDLDQKQFNKLCNIIINNGKINNFARDFKKIVESCDFDVDKDTIYTDLIDNRIKFLTKNDANNISSNLFDDLLIFADKFNQNQIKAFYQVCKQKEFINSFENSIILILSKNEKQLDENLKLGLYRMKIDLKLNELDKLSFGYPTARDILEYLGIYSNYFSTPQLYRLCMISITNSQVYNCFICTNALRKILRVNKDKINSELYEEVALKNNL